MPPAAPALARVLCATDLSEFGDRAVPLAFGIAAPGGHVTLLHVLHTPELPSPLVPRYGEKHPSPEELATGEREARAHLDGLAGPLGAARGIPYEVLVARAAHVSAAILAEAERIDASCICLATHSRKGLAQLVLGSAAHEVLHRAGRPVLLVPSPLAR
jgi:nucleotide-binding universal stress UspA family protein